MGCFVVKNRRIKIFLSINHFYIPIPSMKFKTMKFFIDFGIKHSNQVKVDQELFVKYVGELFQMLSDLEPFEIVHVEAEDKGKKFKVVIKTI